jgi:acetylglutamate kinase
VAVQPPVVPSDRVQEAIRKASVLIEALHYIRQFRGRISVIKIGGSYMDQPSALEHTLQDVVFMETVGMRPVLVHGGGKAINRAMQESGLQPRFVLGRRYTDEATLRVVARVLVDEINRDLVERIQQLGGRAAGLHFRTCPVLEGRPTRFRDAEGRELDLGRVGEVTRVDTRLIEGLCEGGVVPVIPPLAIEEGRGKSAILVEDLLNVNADTAAAAIAAALKAEKLVILTDTGGIWRDRSDPGSLASSLTAAECRELIRNGVIDEGMIPKVEACLRCLDAGVRKTHIVDGRIRHSLLLEIYTDQGVGTEIVPG